MQCIARDADGKREVAGVHWDYDCYGAPGKIAQVRECLCRVFVWEAQLCRDPRYACMLSAITLVQEYMPRTLGYLCSCLNINGNCS